MSFISIGFMFIGAVMGAGFASGREAWQYFGIFGEQAYFGVAIEAFLFVAVGPVSYTHLTLPTKYSFHLCFLSCNFYVCSRRITFESAIWNS